MQTQEVTVTVGETITLHTEHGEIDLRIDKSKNRGSLVRMCIDAPEDVKIYRSELLDQMCDVCGSVVGLHNEAHSTEEAVICIDCLSSHRS